MNTSARRAYDVGTLVALLLSIGVGAWVAWQSANSAASDLFNVRTQIALVAITAATAVIALWYAYLTRRLAETAQRQATSAERQMAVTEKQLTIADGQLEAAREQIALMYQEVHDTRLARLQDQKPVVFIDRVEDANDPRNVRYVARNVGGGFALNVYYFDVTISTAVSLGALAAGEERTLPATLNRALCDGDAGLRGLVVSEGQFTRTTQWTPTLNLRTQTAGDHRGQVIHRTASAEVIPPRYQHQSLTDYMTANRGGFHKQLSALTEQDYLGPRLLEQRAEERKR